MSESGWVVDVSAETFREQVVERSRSVPVVVDFWAEWCGPCRLLGPLLERLIEERKGEVVLAKVDIDRAQDLAATFGIQSVPTVVAFRDGSPLTSFMGALPEPELRRFLEDLVPSEADREAAAAVALESASPEEAEASYREVLAEEPHHETACVGLARLLLHKGALAEAREVLGNVPLGSEGKDEVRQLAALITLQELGQSQPAAAELRARLEGEGESPELRLALGCALAKEGDYEGALAELLAAGQRDRALAKGQVREAMVAVFDAVGQSEPLAVDYRRKLASLLF